jgi:hypothetical protein
MPRRRFDDDSPIAEHVVIRRRDERRLAAFQRAEVRRLSTGRRRIRKHHLTLGLSYEPRRAREQVRIADMVPMKVREREIRDVGRCVADFVQLRLQLSRGRTVPPQRARSARRDQPIGHDADVPHQRASGMRDKEAGYGHHIRRDLGPRQLVGSNVGDVELSAVEHVQPDKT